MFRQRIERILSFIDVQAYSILYKDCYKSEENWAFMTHV